MKANEYIISKQIQWAMNRDIPLIGSKGDRGRKAYTSNLEQNLFEPLLPEVRFSFIRGEGNEVHNSFNNPAKMQAVHSSSALAVNVFQFWQRINQVPVIAAACGFCQKGRVISEDIVFEKKYPTGIQRHFSPNIDVVLNNSANTPYKFFAIECKFSEAYSSEGHSGLATEYLDLPNAWSDIPNLYEFAESISPMNNRFTYLHAAQLIKHILGLKKNCGSKQSFKLLYLWYDVLGREGAIHREEIEQFTLVTKADGVNFHSMTYQELILELSKDHRQRYSNYIKYLTERYL